MRLSYISDCSTSLCINLPQNIVITIVHSNPVALESHTGLPSRVADNLQADLGLD